MHYVKGLAFTSEPDYAYLLKLFDLREIDFDFSVEE